jgi:hypothetical protein
MTVHNKIDRVRVDDGTRIDLEPLADAVAGGDESEVVAELICLGFRLDGWTHGKREELVPAPPTGLCPGLQGRGEAARCLGQAV